MAESSRPGTPLSTTLSNQRSASTPPTDAGEISSSEAPAALAVKKSNPPRSVTATPSARETIKIVSDTASNAENVEPLTISEGIPEGLDDFNVDAIFETTASESEGGGHLDIPEYNYKGPMNYSDMEDHTPANPATFTVSSAGPGMLEDLIAKGGVLFPNSVHESPTPSPFPKPKRRGKSAMPGVPSAPMTTESVRISRSVHRRGAHSRNNSHFSTMSSPTRRSPRKQAPPMEVEIPEPSPLVLLHVTLLPLPVQGRVSSILVGHLRKTISPTIVSRGMLLPHPQDDYDGMVSMIAENLGLEDEAPPAFCKAKTRLPEDEEASHSDASYMSESEYENTGEESFKSHCPTCSRRRLKPSYMRNDKPRRARRLEKPGEKWYTINIFASNGLMRDGAWRRSWEEMERVDVEVCVTPGFEDLTANEKPASRHGSWRQRSRRSTRRLSMADFSSSDENDAHARRSKSSTKSAGRRRKDSGSRSVTGSLRSTKSPFIKEEPMSEPEGVPDSIPLAPKYAHVSDVATDSDGMGGKRPEYVKIWKSEPNVKEAEPVAPAREDSWVTEDEDKLAKPQVSASPSRRESNQTALHNTVVDSDSDSPSGSGESKENSAAPEPAPAEPTPAEDGTSSRRVSGIHRLHPSSRQSSVSSIEFKKDEDEEDVEVDDKPISRPVSRPVSRHTTPEQQASEVSMAVGLALSSPAEHLAALDDLFREASRKNTPAFGFPEDEEDPEEFMQPVKERTASLSPAPQGGNSALTTPNVSPMASRSPSIERVSRRNTGSFRGNSENPRSPSPPPFTPQKEETENRGRNRSRSFTRSRSPSPESEVEEEVIPKTQMQIYTAQIKDLYEHIVKTIQSTPLPTLLLISIPVVSLVAFNVNSYYTQKNLDMALREFRQAHMQSVVPPQYVHQTPQYTTEKDEEEEHQRWYEERKREREQIRKEREELQKEKEEREKEEREKEEKDKEPLYGREYGGRCVLPEDVADAIRKAHLDNSPSLKDAVVPEAELKKEVEEENEEDDEEDEEEEEEQEEQSRPATPKEDRPKPSKEESRPATPEERPAIPNEESRPATPKVKSRPNTPKEESRPATPKEATEERPRSRPRTPKAPKTPEKVEEKQETWTDRFPPAEPLDEQEHTVEEPVQQVVEQAAERPVERPRTPPSRGQESRNHHHRQQEPQQNRYERPRTPPSRGGQGHQQPQRQQPQHNEYAGYEQQQQQQRPQQAQYQHQQYQGYDNRPRSQGRHRQQQPRYDQQQQQQQPQHYDENTHQPQDYQRYENGGQRYYQGNNNNNNNQHPAPSAPNVAPHPQAESHGQHQQRLYQRPQTPPHAPNVQGNDDSERIPFIDDSPVRDSEYSSNVINDEERDGGEEIIIPDGGETVHPPAEGEIEQEDHQRSRHDFDDDSGDEKNGADDERHIEGSSTPRSDEQQPTPEPSPSPSPTSQEPTVPEEYPTIAPQVSAEDAEVAVDDDKDDVVVVEDVVVDEPLPEPASEKEEQIVSEEAHIIDDVVDEHDDSIINDDDDNDSERIIVSQEDTYNTRDTLTAAEHHHNYHVPPQYAQEAAREHYDHYEPQQQQRIISRDQEGTARSEQGVQGINNNNNDNVNNHNNHVNYRGNEVARPEGGEQRKIQHQITHDDITITLSVNKENHEREAVVAPAAAAVVREERRVEAPAPAPPPAPPVVERKREERVAREERPREEKTQPIIKHEEEVREKPTPKSAPVVEEKEPKVVEKKPAHKPSAPATEKGEDKPVEKEAKVEKKEHQQHSKSEKKEEHHQQPAAAKAEKKERRNSVKNHKRKESAAAKAAKAEAKKAEPAVVKEEAEPPVAATREPVAANPPAAEKDFGDWLKDMREHDEEDTDDDEFVDYDEMFKGKKKGKWF